MASRSPAGIRFVTLVASSAFATGCYTNQPYLVETEALARASALPLPERAAAILDGQRADDGKVVRVRLRTLALESATVAADGRTRVRSHTYNALTTAGHALTWIGSAISIGATAGLVATGFDYSHPSGLALGTTALAAEPVMLTGTLLWIFGETSRRPEEVRGAER